MRNSSSGQVIWYVKCAGKRPLEGPQSSWPQLKLVTLVLQGTQVTPACLENLKALSELEYLDMRCTSALCLPVSKLLVLKIPQLNFNL